MRRMVLAGPVPSVRATVPSLPRPRSTSASARGDVRRPRAPPHEPPPGPSQARGDDGVDARADVFSFGACSAYEMLTGALPFDEHTKGFHAALLLRVTLDRPPPPARARVPTLPEAVDECLRRALSPDRERRTATAGAFAGPRGAGRAAGLRARCG